MSDGLGSYNGWFGTETPDVRLRFGKHFCVFCGHNIKLEKRSCTEKFDDIKRYYVAYCPTCKKEIHNYTQIRYEINEKRLNKIYDCLLAYAKPENIKKVWVDKNGDILNHMPSFENLYKILFFVRIGNKDFQIPCAETRRVDSFYGEPIGFKKDNNFKKAFAELKKQAKVAKD